MRAPKTLHDFYSQFPDEDACWAALRQRRWPHGFVCPRCGDRGSHRLRTRRLEQCRACRYQASPTAGAPNKTLVAGAVEQRERSAGSVRLSAHASKGELGPFVRGVIDAREATVLTDGLPAYAHLGPAGIDHRPEVQGHPARAAEILPWIHKVFSNLQTWLRGTFHGVSLKHPPRYLQEFSYRFDRSAREAELFRFVLRRAVRGEPISYARLTAEVVG